MRLKTVKSQKDEENSYYNEKYSKQIDCWNVEFSDGTTGKTRSFKISEVGFEGELEKNDKGMWVQKRDEQSSFGSKGGNKYDSDGQKQGMAIKSACDYVTKYSTDKLSPLEFAGAVEKYATALYNLELKKQEVPNSAAWEEARQKALKIKEEARLKAERESSSVEIEEIDNTPIDISDIPF